MFKFRHGLCRNKAMVFAAMTDFRVTIQELFENQREKEWQQAGIDERDIEDSRLLGICYR